MTVEEMLARMTAREFDSWRHYFRKNGFPVDRQVGATARAGSAICGTWGGDVSPSELIPQFVPTRRSARAKSLIAFVSALPGAQVIRHGR